MTKETEEQIRAEAAELYPQMTFESMEIIRVRNGYIAGRGKSIEENERLREACEIEAMKFVEWAAKENWIMIRKSWFKSENDPAITTDQLYQLYKKENQ